jgi:hypothetical protein
MFFGKLQQGGSLTKSNEVPDVKEMVVYKLLEMAEIGKDLTD